MIHACTRSMTHGLPAITKKISYMKAVSGRIVSVCLCHLHSIVVSDLKRHGCLPQSIYGKLRMLLLQAYLCPWAILMHA
jgi:hypothetical protein